MDWACPFPLAGVKTKRQITCEAVLDLVEAICSVDLAAWFGSQRQRVGPWLPVMLPKIGPNKTRLGTWSAVVTSIVGSVSQMDPTVFSLWNDAPVKIAQPELLAVVQGLLTFAFVSRCLCCVGERQRRASHGFDRGRSDHGELGRVAQIAHSMLSHAL